MAETTEQKALVGALFLGVFSLVGFVLSLGITIPEGLGALRLVCILAVMAGFVVGTDVRRRATFRAWRLLITVLTAAISCACVLFYIVTIEQNLAGAWVVIVLGALLFGSFFGIGFLPALIERNASFHVTNGPVE